MITKMSISTRNLISFSVLLAKIFLCATLLLSLIFTLVTIYSGFIGRDIIVEAWGNYYLGFTRWNFHIYGGSDFGPGFINFTFGPNSGIVNYSGETYLFAWKYMASPDDFYINLLFELPLLVIILMCFFASLILIMRKGVG